jgi:hypothetical protein
MNSRQERQPQSEVRPFEHGHNANGIQQLKKKKTQEGEPSVS